MAIPRISAIDAVEAALGSRERALVGVERVPGSGGEAAIPDQKPVKETSAQRPAELVLGSKTDQPRVSVPPENYAKVRYDPEAGRVLIQIVNGSSGEVVREIPPEAWPTYGSVDMPLPKGTLVEKAR